MRGKGTCRIPGMDARFLDMLHDPADDDRFPVGDRVHVDLDGVLKEPVDEDRFLLGSGDGLCEVSAKTFLVVDDLHRPPAEDVGRTEQDLSLIHISEPTRRTPISYAVFCLKKKK